MDIAHIHIQAREHGHGLFHGVGNIVELQIQKDLVATGLDLADDLRPFGIVQLHADLHKGLAPGELIQKGEHLLLAAEIAGDDHIFTHACILL